MNAKRPGALAVSVRGVSTRILQPSPVEACGSSYTIRSGDSLEEIAGKCGLTVPLLLAANGTLPDPLGLAAGATIRIPDIPRAVINAEAVVVVGPDTKKMISCAALNPFGIAVSTASGLSGSTSGVWWKLPEAAAPGPAGRAGDRVRVTPPPPLANDQTATRFAGYRIGGCSK